MNESVKVKQLILLIVLAAFCCGNLYAQRQQLVTVHLENATLKDLFRVLESQTTYRFSYRNKVVDDRENVTVNKERVPVTEVLDVVLETRGLTYTIISDKSIVISDKVSSSETATGQVSGTVKDAAGESVIGATVQIEGSTTGAITDMDGHFSIPASGQGKLVISYIGYETMTVSYRIGENLQIVLHEDNKMLDEVVVVGYGTQKKVNLTGAVGTVTSKELENKSVVNVLEALQGVVPNLNITYGSGSPGSTPDVNIRGYESINGGSPLIIVDGMQSNEYLLSRLSPEDVESISVLKDASASAIYGARAAFGVILVTTKGGSRRAQKTSVTFSSNLMFSTPYELPEMVNTYVHAKTMNEALRQAGSPIRFKEEDVEKMRLYAEDPLHNPVDEVKENGDYYYYGTIDYQKETLKRYAMRWRNNVNISGGSERFDYYLSGGYTSDEGFFKYSNQEVDIYNFRAKVNANVTKWWKIGTHWDYTKDQESEPHGYLDWWHQIYTQRTYFPIINPVNGLYTSTPIAYLKEGSRDKSEETTTFLSFDTQITPLKNWNIYGKWTHRENNDHSRNVAKKLTLADNYGYVFPKDAIWNGKAETSSVEEYSSTSKQITIDLYSDYEITIADDHYLKALVGFNQMEYWNNAFSAEREDMISDNIPSLNLTTGEDYVSQSEYHWATRSLFYRLNYDYKKRYLFEASGRYDGSSRFAKDSRFGFFPSFSIGWRISEEAFMKSTRNWLDNLKLRLSYGTLGNQEVSTYAYISSMDSSTVSYLLNGVRPIGVNPGSLVASDLTWETIHSYNLGIDFTLFSNRLNASFDLFRRETLDMLTSGDAMPGILGASAPQRNAADLATTGWELSLNWNDRIGNTRYGIGIVLSDSDSKITKYDNPTGSLETRFVGQRIGDIWGYVTEGFIDTEEKLNHINETNAQQYFYNGTWKMGDIQYRDLNGDGKIDRGAYTLKDHGDLTIIGNNQPHYKFGITLNAEWKGLAIGAFFQGVCKRDVMPSGYMFWPLSYQWANVMPHQLDTWSEDNRDAYYPQLEAEADRNFQTQTKYLQNAAYIRLKSLSVSYQLPKSFLKNTFIEGVRFTLSGRNLFTWTGLIEPFDPELDNTDGLYYPLKREFAFGVTLNF